MNPGHPQRGHHSGRTAPDFRLYEALKADASRQAKDMADYERRIREAARLARV